MASVLVGRPFQQAVKLCEHVFTIIKSFIMDAGVIPFAYNTHRLLHLQFVILEDVGGGRDVWLGVKTVDGMGQSTGGEGSVFQSDCAYILLYDSQLRNRLWASAESHPSV
jgi:hypothetical protein